MDISKLDPKVKAIYDDVRSHVDTKAGRLSDEDYLNLLEALAQAFRVEFEHAKENLLNI